VVARLALQDFARAEDLVTAWLNCQRSKGLWAAGGGRILPGGIKEMGSDRDEWGSTSHGAHHLEWMAAILYAAMKAQHKTLTADVVDLICQLQAATPEGNVVWAGGRWWKGEMPPAGGGDADQRIMVDTWYQWWDGRRPRIPRNAATSNDWTGQWILGKIEAAHAAGESWAAAWGDIKRQVEDAGQYANWRANLPATYNYFSVLRGPHGHVARMGSIAAMMRPAIWATADYRLKGDAGQSYGGDPAFARCLRLNPDDKVADLLEPFES